VYLRIATELYLKRLIVGGYEKVYELGKDFRNEGTDLQHNPEFNMVEVYTAYTDYTDVMNLVEEMIRFTANQVNGTGKLTYKKHDLDLDQPFKRLHMVDAIKEYTGIDFWQEMSVTTPVSWPTTTAFTTKLLEGRPHHQRLLRRKGSGPLNGPNLHLRSPGRNLTAGQEERQGSAVYRPVRTLHRRKGIRQRLYRIERPRRPTATV
jgi:Lysyl-tRNA synthetase (class II)